MKLSMQLICASFVLAALVMGAVPAMAQEAAGGYKIAVVDFKKVMENYQEREEEYKRLQQEVDTLQKGIDEKFKTIEGLKADYDKNVGTWDQSTREQKEEKINTLYDEYRADLAQHQRKIDRMERDVIEKLFEKVRTVVAQVGAQEKYHLILEANSPNPPRGGVLYHDATIDITSKVIEKLQ